jgi:hypothetical protein
MKKAKVRWVVLGLFLGGLLAVAGPSPAAEKGSGLPGMTTWTAFDVGSRGYVQGAAISKGITAPLMYT